SGTWTVGTVDPSLAQTLVITARVAGAAASTNFASISRADQFDPDPNNDADGAVVTPQQADLAVTKTVDDARPNVGDLVHFVIAVTHAGLDAATNVALLDKLPPGLTFVSAAPSLGTYDPNTGPWTVGMVVSAFPPTLQITARVTGAAAATNVASVSHADQFD